MCTDITHAARDPRSCGISAPLRLLIATAFLWLHQPVLDIFHQHFANGTKLAMLDQMASLVHGGIASIGVGQRKHELLLLDQLHQRLCLGVCPQTERIIKT